MTPSSPSRGDTAFWEVRDALAPASRRVIIPYFFPGIIEHDRTTDRNSCFVLHEVSESLLVIMAPLVQKRAGVEQHCREFLEW